MLLEISGTLAELYAADSLLQGKTKIDKLLCCVSKADNKVHSQGSIENNGMKTKTTKRTTFDRPIESDASAVDRRAHQKTVVCATVMISNTITEASGLIVGSLFWICCNANPKTAGGGGIPLSQAIINFVIMLFGELVLSDSVVAYMSHKFKERYVIDIAHEWAGFRETQKSAILGLIAIVSLISSAVIMQIPEQFCLTSIMPNEEDWTLTLCPSFWSGRNITNLIRVDDMYLTEWGDIM